MTTAYTQGQSPRLPANHPVHVERVLAREDAWRKERKTRRFWRAMVSATALSILILTAVLILSRK